MIASGFGSYIATPMLRAVLEANPEPTEKEATDAIYKCMQVLFYRDARSFPKVCIIILILISIYILMLTS